MEPPNEVRTIKDVLMVAFHETKSGGCVTGSFSNKNTRVPPVKKTDFGFVQAFGEMTPEITGYPIYKLVLMATRAPRRPGD